MPVARSILDLAAVVQGGTAADAFRDALALARRAEALAYRRFWVAEHHNMPGIASSATAVLLAHLAGGTERIRIGSGGIMLPNHAPLTIAEQFGTLETLFPGRIDLGIGRAPGGDRQVAAALRRGLGESVDDFPRNLEELRRYFAHSHPGQAVRSIPGEGLDLPVYLLGSSDYSARLAGALGLPFAFASHFAPDALLDALDLYREHFRPSASLEKPYAMVALNVFAAETDEEAARLFTSHQQMALNLFRGHPDKIPPPVADMEGHWSSAERARVIGMTRFSAVGDKTAVRRAFETVIESTGADELIFSGMIYDREARLRSYEIAAEAFDSIPATR